MRCVFLYSATSVKALAMRSAPLWNVSQAAGGVCVRVCLSAVCKNLHVFKVMAGFLISDIVNCDLKSTLRVLYNLFTRYRHVE